MVLIKKKADLAKQILVQEESKKKLEEIELQKALAEAKVAEEAQKKAQ
jgi:hypothetical protein